MYQNHCTISCINHVPKPIPYHASTMYQNLYHIMHQPCTNIYHKPCTMRCASSIYHITHDMSQSCHTPCTITSMMCLNQVDMHPTYTYMCQIHVPKCVSQPCAISLMICLNQVPKYVTHTYAKKNFLKHVPTSP
jgi:hypothetical protein